MDKLIGRTSSCQAINDDKGGSSWPPHASASGAGRASVNGVGTCGTPRMIDSPGAASIPRVDPRCGTSRPCPPPAAPQTPPPVDIACYGNHINNLSVISRSYEFDTDYRSVGLVSSGDQRVCLVPRWTVSRATAWAPLGRMISKGRLPSVGGRMRSAHLAAIWWGVVEILGDAPPRWATIAPGADREATAHRWRAGESPSPGLRSHLGRRLTRRHNDPKTLSAGGAIGLATTAVLWILLWWLASMAEAAR